jgi:WD40 repeat protein
MGKKVLCGKFAERLKNNFAVGDEDNNLILYNIVSPKPIAVLNQQANNNVSALTALTFTQSDDQVVVGSSRGSINVWDLNTLKGTPVVMQ